MNISTETLCEGNLVINSDYQALLEHNDITTPKRLWGLDGESVKKALKERHTSRALLEVPAVDSKIEAYLKRYNPVGIREKLKNIMCAKPCDSGAEHEWESICLFNALGLPTMIPLAMAKFENGDSCILTLGITDYERASEIFKRLTPDDRVRRRKLIREIAGLAANMHSAGIAHQDFYLVHFFVKENEDDKVYLIDLQRAILSDKIARRWLVKDLAQLLFSARKHVSNTDILFFWKTYTQYRGGDMYKRKSLVRAILSKAEKITARDERKRARKKA